MGLEDRHPLHDFGAAGDEMGGGHCLAQPPRQSQAPIEVVVEQRERDKIGFDPEHRGGERGVPPVVGGILVQKHAVIPAKYPLRFQVGHQPGGLQRHVVAGAIAG